VVLLRHSLKFFFAIGLLDGWDPVGGPCGVLFCCMALSASDVYHLTGDELRQVCLEQGLDSAGPVRSLRQRLVDYVRSGQLDESVYGKMAQAGTMTDSEVKVGTPESNGCSHASSGDSPVPVLVELLRQVPPLSSEDPEAIMWLFLRLDEVHEVNLVDDKTFVMRILPLLSGSVLTFVGGCLRSSSTWAECKVKLLKEYFPHFVRERLIRDLIVFNFQGERQSLRAYIDQVFGAARFLQYEATETELVDRVVMNFHSSILTHAAFINKPVSLTELHRVVGVIEEKSAVAKERERVELDARRTAMSRTVVRGLPHSTAVRNVTRPSIEFKCWGCGNPGHLKRHCPRRVAPSGNGHAPGGPFGPGRG